MRRVLFITYYFPPAGGPGVQRVMSFARHLPSFGWEPTILTVDGGLYPDRDEESLRNVPPDLIVRRARTWEPFALYNRMRGHPTTESLPIGHAGQRGGGIMSRVARLVRANLFLPDARIGWYPAAVREGVRIAREVGVDAILTSSPPHSVHLIGRAVARRTGVPWIADFRDPWTEVFYNRDLPRVNLARSIDKRMEQSCVQSASAISTINPMVRDTLGPTAKHAHIIPNGYEEEDFTGDVPVVDGRFQLAYVGTMSGIHESGPLFRVLGAMVRENAGFGDDLSLVFAGNIHEPARREIAEAGIEPNTTYAGFIPHADAVRLLRSATCPLFIGPRGLLTSKIFEYLATGRPLLALAEPGGEVDILMPRAGERPTVDPADETAIRERVEELYTAWKAGTLESRPPMQGVEGFSRRGRVGQLAVALDSVVTPTK